MGKANKGLDQAFTIQFVFQNLKKEEEKGKKDRKKYEKYPQLTRH